MKFYLPCFWLHCLYLSSSLCPLPQKSEETGDAIKLYACSLLIVSEFVFDSFSVAVEAALLVEFVWVTC